MIEGYYLEYSPICMTTEKLAFKLLIIISLLADSNLAYRGTLQDISIALGYSAKPDTARYRRLRAAIEQLEKLDLIKTIKDDNIYTLTLSKSAQKKTIKIAKNIVNTISNTLMNEKNGHDWSYTLKVLFDIYYRFDIYDRDNNNRYYKEIAADLNINPKQVSIAMKQLERFEAVITQKHYRTVGSGDNKEIRRDATTIIPTAWIKS